MKKDDHLVVALVSLVLAATLHVMPVTGSWIVWKPNFLLLVTMAWIFHGPSEFGVFFCGECWDFCGLFNAFNTGSSYVDVCFLWCFDQRIKSLESVPLVYTTHRFGVIDCAAGRFC